MVTKTATRPSPRSSHSHSHSHSQNFRSKTPTTPISPPARDAISVGQHFSPSTGALRLSPAIQSDQSTSPGYFGLVVDGAGDSDEAGVAQKPTWSAPGSSMLSFSAGSPKPKPIDHDTECESLKRQAGPPSSSTLDKGGFSYFTSPGVSSPRPRFEVHGPSLSLKSMPKARKDAPETVSRVESRDSAYASSADLRLPSDPPSAGPALSQGSSASTMSPTQRPSPSPVNDIQRPSPLSAKGDDMINLMMHGHHRHESPIAREGGPALITPAHLKDMIEQLPSSDFLLLDLRVYPQFSQSRIKNALNLCIPTTLLKRPSFNVQKLQDTFADDTEKARFAQWTSAKYIVVYEASSIERKDATSSMNTLKKFGSEGWKGTGYILKGGFAEFAKTYPSLIDSRPSREIHASKVNLTLGTALHKGAPVAGGCMMPATQHPANPFFGNIRQNQDLRDGVGLEEIKLPEELTEDALNILPRWLQVMVSREDRGVKASKKFLRIEEEEQDRMKKALSLGASYNTEAKDSDDFRIAGLEKGNKNRYNNIWPFEHTRVRLQGHPEPGCDYVNASYVQASRSNKRYIAAQGPLPATFEDFWTVIWEQDVRVIVMLTAEEEGGQLKCHSYWASGEYGPFKVKILSEKKVSLLPSKIQMQNERRDLGRRRATTSAENTPITPATDQHLATVRTFALTHSSYPFIPIRETTQIQYTSWPDFGAPASPAQILSLVELSNQIQRASSPLTEPPRPMSPEEDENIKPILVHCSAGCGRTGTFCTVDSVIDMIKRQCKERKNGVVPMDTTESSDHDLKGPWLLDDELDLIEATVEDFRRQRLSMVQSLKQYALCYATVVEWITPLYVGGRTTTSRGRSGSDAGVS